MNPLSAVRQLMPGMTAPPSPVTPAVIPAAQLETLSAPAALNLSAPRETQPFSSVLGNLVGAVNQKQFAATQAVHDIQSGQNVSLHQTMIAIEEASVSFQLMVEVRNKVLESYQELMRMQV